MAALANFMRAEYPGTSVGEVAAFPAVNGAPFPR